MKYIFARHGIPVVSDNVPFSSRELINFAADLGVNVTTPSPEYPQSNGQSERSIQTRTQLLRKSADDQTEPYVHSTFDVQKHSCDRIRQLTSTELMSRKLRDKVPRNPKHLTLQTSVVDARTKLLKRQEGGAQVAPPCFSPNTLSLINWLKFTKKIFGASPQKPRAPPPPLLQILDLPLGSIATQSTAVAHRLNVPER